MVSEAVLNEAIETMATLNDKACTAMLETRATSCTDVTGFGFLGHLSEMTRASQVSARIHAQDIPMYDGLVDLVGDGYVTRGDVTNRAYAGKISFGKTPKDIQSILVDPQTSGGLLVSMPPEDVSGFQNHMKSFGQEAWIVGEIVDQDPAGKIEVVP